MGRWLAKFLLESPVQLPDIPDIVEIKPMEAPDITDTMCRLSALSGTSSAISGKISHGTFWKAQPSVDSSESRELFEERAAIMEFEGGFLREEAEEKARIWIEKRNWLN